MMGIDRRALLGVGLAAAAASPSAAAFRPRKPAPPRPVTDARLLKPDPALWDPQIDPTTEGMAEGPNGAVYHRIYGAPGLTPIIGLHGGPAAGHTYMRPYAALATDRQVVLYDQSGCGKSARPADLDLYTVESFVAELEVLRAFLGFERIILLGHSWGGFLAGAYAAAYPARVQALVLAGAAARWRDFQEAAEQWLAELGPEALAVAARADPADPAFQALQTQYYSRHLCRLDPWPAWFTETAAAIGDNPVYRHLNGPSEFVLQGALKDLDLTASLRTLPMPALVTCGEFDEAPPSVGRRLATLLPRGKLAVFEGLSHMSHVEDPVRVMARTAKFLATL